MPVEYGTVAAAPSNEESIEMAAALAEKSCIPCRGGIPPLSREAAEDDRHRCCRQQPDCGERK